MAGPSDAVDREVTFLTTVGDGLPALLKGNGGKFDVVQGYWRKTPTRGRNLYVVRAAMHRYKSSFGRSRYQHDMVLKIEWSVAEPNLEQDQRDLDLALSDLETRINGPTRDKTHGGMFLAAAASVGDGPGLGGHPVEMRFIDPETAMQTGGPLRVQVMYRCFDEFSIGA